jgi:hypothetical protein
MASAEMENLIFMEPLPARIRLMGKRVKGEGYLASERSYPLLFSDHYSQFAFDCLFEPTGSTLFYSCSHAGDHDAFP